MAGWASTLPGTIDALVDAFTGAAGLAGVAVSDGPALVDVSLTDLVTVGYSDNADMAATAQTSAEGFGGSPNRESYDVYCSTSSFTGDDDQRVTRDRALALYAAACDAILADPTLGGTVLRAMPGEFTLHQSATTRGRATTVQFTVSVTAYTA